MSLRDSLATTLRIEGHELRVAFAREGNGAPQPDNAQHPAQPTRNDLATEPGKSSGSAATPCATTPQHAGCAPPSEAERDRNRVAQLHSLGSATRNFGPLTAHRRTAALVAAINHCCDIRGDDDENRAGLIRECCALPPVGQGDMREHFEQEAKRWERPKR